MQHDDAKQDLAAYRPLGRLRFTFSVQHDTTTTPTKTSTTKQTCNDNDDDTNCNLCSGWCPAATTIMMTVMVSTSRSCDTTRQVVLYAAQSFSLHSCWIQDSVLEMRSANSQAPMSYSCRVRWDQWLVTLHPRPSKSSRSSIMQPGNL